MSISKTIKFKADKQNQILKLKQKGSETSKRRNSNSKTPSIERIIINPKVLEDQSSLDVKKNDKDSGSSENKNVKNLTDTIQK